MPPFKPGFADRCAALSVVVGILRVLSAVGKDVGAGAASRSCGAPGGVRRSKHARLSYDRNYGHEDLSGLLQDYVADLPLPMLQKWPQRKDIEL